MSGDGPRISASHYGDALANKGLQNTQLSVYYLLALPNKSFTVMKVTYLHLRGYPSVTCYLTANELYFHLAMSKCSLEILKWN